MSPLPRRRIQQMRIIRISSFSPTHWLRKPPALLLASANIRIPPLVPWPHLRRYVTENWHLQSGRWEVGQGDAGAEVANSCQRRLSRMKIRSHSSKLKTFQGDFPGSPVVKTLYFQCTGRGFDPWSGNKNPTCHVGCGKKKKNPKNKNRQTNKKLFSDFPRH